MASTLFIVHAHNLNAKTRVHQSKQIQRPMVNPYRASTSAIYHHPEDKHPMLRAHEAGPGVRAEDATDAHKSS